MKNNRRINVHKSLFRYWFERDFKVIYYLEKSVEDFLVLVARKGTLLIELGLLHAFFGNFPHEVKNIIFTWWGACKYVHEVRMSMWDENVWNLCELKMPMQGENVQASWKCPCKLRRSTQGENAHARWHFRWWRDTPPYLRRKWPCKHMRWKCPHKVRMSAWGENTHVRWKKPMWGENAHARWLFRWWRGQLTIA